MVFVAKAAGDPVGAFQWLTAGIAILGLILAIVSLAWQVFTWRGAGSVVRVDISEASMIGAGMPHLDVYSVTARNVGRLAVSVTQWAVRLPDDSVLVTPIPIEWQGPHPPHTLEPGHSSTWYMIKDQVLESVKGGAFRSPVKVQGLVSLGTGKQVVSKRAATLEWE